VPDLTVGVLVRREEDARPGRVLDEDHIERNVPLAQPRGLASLEDRLEDGSDDLVVGARAVEPAEHGDDAPDVAGLVSVEHRSLHPVANPAERAGRLSWVVLGRRRLPKRAVSEGDARLDHRRVRAPGAGDDVARHDRERVGPLVERQQHAVVDDRGILTGVAYGFDIVGVPDDQVYVLRQSTACPLLVTDERTDG
jgi:hypothetical protein